MALFNIKLVELSFLIKKKIERLPFTILAEQAPRRLLITNSSMLREALNPTVSLGHAKISLTIKKERLLLPVKTLFGIQSIFLVETV